MGTCDEKKLRLRVYQESVKFMVHPFSEIHRLLIVHQVGSGKTLTMVSILANFFYDPRPKVIVFPTQPVVDNFYQELVKLPGPYAKWIRAHGLQAKDKDKLKDALALKGKVRKGKVLKPESHGLAGPLRAFTYGTFTKGRENPMFKITGSVPITSFDSCVLLMDEAHHLLEEKNRLFRELVERTRSKAIICGFTATPGKNEKEGLDLLQCIKGAKFKKTISDDGFVSFFMQRPLALFAELVPSTYVNRGKNTEIVQLVADNLKKYEDTRFRKRGGTTEWWRKRASKSDPISVENFSAKEPQYTEQKIERHPNASAQVLESYSTKLFHLAKHVVASRKKTVVMIERKAGFGSLPN